ncbi:MAG: citrate/2-methylcitrate synthase [Paracoccus sp. (in: a-proteobacteria)]|nr:citrate/2-methylcitrate synthase [Paracoccus sp. (in: a-proteobacteria)]
MGVSTLCWVPPEGQDRAILGASDIIDGPIAVETDDDNVTARFLNLSHQIASSETEIRAMQTALNLYAEHEFNALTFTAAPSHGPAWTSIPPFQARQAHCAPHAATR